MDSITQLVTGGVLAAAVVPQAHRRAALWAGAALGTLPDLDVLPLSWLNDNPVIKMTAHRSLTHSLLILPLLATLIWWWYKRRGARVAAAPQAWWWAMLLALATHPLLDCFNAYGTWLFWPFGEYAIMWGNMFVLDPAFTLPMLIAFIGLVIAPRMRLGSPLLYGGIALSALYLSWSLAAQLWVMNKVDAQLQSLGLGDAPRLVAATPLNTLLWQVLVMTDDGVLSADYSLLQDNADAPLQFTFIPSDMQAIKDNAHNRSLERLRRFNQGFFIAAVEDDALIIRDVRMGRAPDFTFNFTVARRQNGAWQELPVPEQHYGKRDTAGEWHYLLSRLSGSAAAVNATRAP